MDKPAILVTGGSARIGAEIVRTFAAQGWHVVIHHGHSDQEAAALAATLPSAEVVKCDLLDSDAAVEMVRDLAARLPDWRVLVNCASVFRPDDVTDLDPETNANCKLHKPCKLKGDGNGCSEVSCEFTDEPASCTGTEGCNQFPCRGASGWVVLELLP